MRFARPSQSISRFPWGGRISNSSNRINPGDTKGQSFIYAAVFIDVWSRLVVAYPIANKNAATLRRVVQQAWLHFGGFENLTVDGESAANTKGDNVNGLKLWCAQQGCRVWINLKPSRGGSTTYICERVIRTLKERLYKRARVQGDRNWSLPVTAYWAVNPPPAAAVLSLPANATLPQRKRREVSRNALIPSAMNQIVRQYNQTRHSSLGTTPADVFLNGAVPLYKSNADTAGICTLGSACAPQQKRGIRRRAIETLFKPGDQVRVLKVIRDFQKRSEQKVWSAGIWTVLGTLRPSGLANYVIGTSLVMFEFNS